MSEIEVASVIQEIEKQLENVLSRRREDIESDLAARIQKEKEAAHKLSLIHISEPTRPY